MWVERSGSLLLASFEIITPRRSHSMTATTRRFDPTVLRDILCISFELGEGTWELSFTSGFGEQVLRRRLRSRDRKALLRAIGGLKHRLGLPGEAHVVSWYAAGREGFWLHRFLARS